ncbi:MULTISPECIES: Stp1/IreP family PP2C-type Ser/Thr phosphatase [Microbulbifer]|uniref:Stp1/IreP family PP2C-type Ser/Thr phosphatase n=1 Tax=Microbulbifer TaxID=48073 RepID=UPI001E629A44|nr:MULTISPECIES: Stp1/IreP family PP2C-type Ser/Thr phosphatase [Microbulbifer]UHQ54567.1 Stp1/IreP family PP2C-type Ser/Thr phosphatase [Microbulbifer sp. YPW16]
MASVRLAVDGQTDIGLFREENEDCICHWEDPDHPFAFVILADGMGGHRGGARASAIATETIRKCLARLISGDFLATPTRQQEEAIRSNLLTAVCSANQLILDAKQATPDHAQMGTTIVAAAIWRDFLVVAHVGDSRAYLWSEQGIQRLTRDDSYVQELIDRGQLTEEEGRRSTLRNQITRALGVTPEVTPSINSRRLTGYNLLLLCSDGLTDYLDDNSLERILNSHRPALTCTRRFIDEANRMGGKDNISAGMIEFQCEAV